MRGHAGGCAAHCAVLSVRATWLMMRWMMTAWMWTWRELGDEVADGAVAGARPMARRSGLARPLVALGHSLGEGQASEEVE